MICRNEEDVHAALVRLGYAEGGKSGSLRGEGNYGPDGTLTFQLMWSHMPASQNREYLTHEIRFRDPSGDGIYRLESHSVRIAKEIPGVGQGPFTADLTFTAYGEHVPDIKGAYLRVRKSLQEVIKVFLLENAAPRKKHREAKPRKI
ncbi:hypothetical protein JHJ32_07695 [Parapedobacter sp. ISTM3]|uniref:hypothetical protein n=1 Tax=Parapedobacter sp. ISTM3 TaxID=2800130 RepID=UPI001905D4A6|nr:hypothetical protein [Parapedobacter sp. ISTM3]MBK1439861.1 hypothetical protein [Parapedobacter sp. ISTM3]